MEASALKFTEWVTGRLKEQANVYKQTRLWNEEQRAATRSSEGGEGRGRGRGRGGAASSNAKKTKGGGGGDAAASHG